MVESNLEQLRKFYFKTCERIILKIQCNLFRFAGVITGQFLEQPGDTLLIGVLNRSLNVSCVLNQTYSYMNWQSEDDQIISISLKVLDKYKNKYRLYHRSTNEGHFFMKLEIISLGLNEQHVQCFAAGPGSLVSSFSKISVVGKFI